MSAKLKEETTIRPARREDMKAVASMIRELADFEKMPAGPKLTVEDLVRDGFEASPPAFRCLVCELSSGELAGYALYFPSYSTWEGRALLLEDLYVRPTLRRQGVGRSLFSAVAKEAVSLSCCRVDFHVLEWNEARGFYEAAGARDLTKDEDWRLYRLSGDALLSVAGPLDPVPTE